MNDDPPHHSTIRSLRRRLGPSIDGFVEGVGRPITRVYASEYVGTVDRPIGDLEAELRDDFAWDPVSVYHYTLSGIGADGSWVYRDGWLADRQLHVVCFERGADRTDVYAHEEFSWLRHPVKHARQVGIRRSRAVAAVRRWLDRRGVACDRQSLPRRTTGHLRERTQADDANLARFAWRRLLRAPLRVRERPLRSGE